jgi:hypothetical protein
VNAPQYYKALVMRDGVLTSGYDGSRWTVGKTRRVKGEVVPCRNGLHFSELCPDALRYVVSPTHVALVKPGRTVVDEGDKAASNALTILEVWPIPKWAGLSPEGMASSKAYVARSRAYAVYSKADAACSKAYAAYSKADAAYSKADAARSKADAACSKAYAAYLKADAARSKADAACSKADAAWSPTLRRADHAKMLAQLVAS